MKKKDMLSSEFKVASEIYRLNAKNEKVWYSKLTKLLKDHMSESTVQNCLVNLSDWGIITAEFGETETGRAGRLLHISGELKDVMAMIYEKFWKNQRNVKRY